MLQHTPCSWLGWRNWLPLGAGLVALLVSCDRTQTESQSTGGPVYASGPSPDLGAPTYRFAVHPLHNPARLLEIYRPLADYLNARISGLNLVVEASRDYPGFEDKIAHREAEFVLPNPWQSLVAMQHGYRVVAMVGAPRDFKGLVIVRRDSGIRTLADLRGKRVAYPSPTALAACIMPQWLFHTNGVNVNRELENRYVGSQESAIMNAFLREAAAGVTWLPPWRAFAADHPNEAAQLTVLAETEPLINNSLMARDDVPSELVAKIQTALIELHDSEEGRRILAMMETERIFPAQDADYAVVRRFVERFEREVRPVKGPP